MILTEEIKNDIKIHAKEEEPRECCGFIVEKMGAYKAKNISQEKGKLKLTQKIFYPLQSWAKY